MVLCYSLRPNIPAIFSIKPTCMKHVQLPLLCSQPANSLKLDQQLFFIFFLYMSVVGELHYATITRPDIAYAVNIVCQYMEHPLEAHWVAVKRILRYLQGTLGHVLLFSLHSPQVVHSLKVYSDADWASVLMTEEAPHVLPSFFRTISSLDGQRNSLWWLDPTQSQNTGA